MGVFFNTVYTSALDKTSLAVKSVSKPTLIDPKAKMVKLASATTTKNLNTRTKQFSLIIVQKVRVAQQGLKI